MHWLNKESLLIVKKFLLIVNENPKEVVNIADKIIDFNKKQKGKEIKILSPKQMV